MNKEKKQTSKTERTTIAAIGVAIAIVACLISVGLGGRFYVSAIEGVIIAFAFMIGKEFGDYTNTGVWRWCDVIVCTAAAVGAAILMVVLQLIFDWREVFC